MLIIHTNPFLSYSFFGYGTPLTFKDVTENDIKNIEKYVQQDLPETLEAALVENKISYTNKQKSWFFGVFALKPEVFYITSGDLKLITKAIAHVNETIGNNNNGIDHFDRKHFCAIKGRISYEQSMCDSVFGLVFGDTRETQNKQKENILAALRQKLFIRAKQIFHNHETDEILSVRSFTLESVQVKLAQNGQTEGSVECSFCEETRPIANVKVYYREVARGSWILSNLNAHMTTHHSSIGEMFKRRTKRAGIKPNRFEPKTEQLNLLPTDSIVEDHLYQLMKRQIIKMGNCVTKNQEAHYEVVFGPKSWEAIKLCAAPGDGDCLFTSLSHQLNGYKIGSDELTEMASELRKNVVHYILENITDFSHELKGRIFESGAVKIHNLLEDCRDFVENSLAQEGFWGGVETIKAVSSMNGVNIIVINDDGSCNMPAHHLNSEFKTTILIFFSGSKDNNHQTDRNHYDSVFWMADTMLANFAKKIVVSENQLRQMNDCSSISIE